ncbi:MAG: hypothetical protein J7K13_03950 [Thermoplasmata archaeon]|nr:hypothetical protein [Thermoplasmata archaeon]
MKKAVFGAIFSTLLMLSMPIVSTVNAGPELIAKNSGERYVPEFVKAVIQEIRSVVDEIMELTGDNETIAKQCRELYDALDGIEEGKSMITIPLAAGTPISGENTLQMFMSLLDDIRENLGDDVANKIIAGINKELKPLLSPLLGDDFDVSDLIFSGSFHSSGYNDVGPAIPYPGHPVSGDDGDVHFMTSQTPAMPCPIVVGNPSSAGEASTAGWSENCTELLKELIKALIANIGFKIAFVSLGILSIKMLLNALKCESKLLLAASMVTAILAIMCGFKAYEYWTIRGIDFSLMQHEGCFRI